MNGATDARSRGRLLKRAGDAKIRTRRVYEAKTRSDGRRILVDRLWPRGLTKADAAVDYWARSIAPSHELRRWYGHVPERWPEFRRRYFAELDANPSGVADVRAQLAHGPVTFLFSSKETQRNNAIALVEYLASRGQPPGPGHRSLRP